MAARTGMANLILRLRHEAQAGTADYTLGGETYWTDDHLEDILDARRVDLWDFELMRYATYDAGGTVVYHDYFAPFGDLEEATSGTTAWIVLEASGSPIGTGTYTVNYVNGHIRFTSDTAGSSRYLTARSYNLAGAAADIWRHRLGSISAYYNFTSDGQTMSRDQWFQHVKDMINYWEGQSGPQQVEVLRGDLNE